jgi:hypothetical protein
VTYFFRLTLIKGTSSLPFLYRGEVDGTHEVFLILDEETDSIRPSDSDGNLIEDPDMIKGFPLMAAHLLTQWKRQGHPPQEIRKFFA